MRRLRLSAVALAGCAVTVLATGPANAATGLADPIPAPIPDSRAAVGLEVVADGMTSPVEASPLPATSAGCT